MKTQKILAGLCLVAVLAACDEIKFGGTFTIHELITFKQASGNVVLNPGAFQTKVILGQEGQQKKIKLEVQNGGSKPTVVQLSFDKNINVADQFTLTAAQLGQTFDLTGNIATTVTRTPEQWGNQSCTAQYQQTVCRGIAASEEVSPELSAKVEESILKFGELAADVSDVPVVKAPNPGQPPYIPTCHPVWVSRPGWQDVRYYYETTTKDIAASFVQAGKVLAEYKGTGSTTQQINTYQGFCR